MLCKKRETHAQIHIVEISLGLLIFASALIFVAGLHTHHSEPSYSQTQLKILGSDVLCALDNTPLNIPNPSDYHNSTAVYEIWGPGKYNETGNISGITDFINRSLPIQISYNVYLRDNTSRIELYIMGSPIGNAASAYRMIVYRGKVYCAELLLWYEPR